MQDFKNDAAYSESKKICQGWVLSNHFSSKHVVHSCRFDSRQWWNGEGNAPREAIRTSLTNILAISRILSIILLQRPGISEKLRKLQNTVDFNTVDILSTDCHNCPDVTTF